MNTKTRLQRPYRQRVRAASAEATGRLILDTFVSQLRDRWFDEIRLESVAAQAQVTVQTVLRRFGSKEALLEASMGTLERSIRARREVAPGDAARAVEVLAEDYEEIGDLIWRLLALEQRHPVIKIFADHGRAGHRDWLGTTFAPQLSSWATAPRARRLDALVVATDLYVWKLFRRDLNRSLTQYKSLVKEMVDAALAPTHPIK